MYVCGRGTISYGYEKVVNGSDSISKQSAKVNFVWQVEGEIRELRKKNDATNTGWRITADNASVEIVIATV